MKGIADLLGRIFLSMVFFYELVDTILFYDNTKDTLTNYGITWMQDPIIITTMILLGVGAFLVCIGYFARLGAMMLLLYWVPFTFIVYSLWNDPPAIQKLNSIYFMRNLAVIGGLFLLLANGAGEYSIKRLIHVMRLPK